MRSKRTADDRAASRAHARKGFGARNAAGLDVVAQALRAKNIVFTGKAAQLEYETLLFELNGDLDLRTQLWRLVRCAERVHNQIDEAFAGQPLLPKLSPLDPENQRRFDAFLGDHRQVAKLLGWAVELHLIMYRVGPEEGWIPWPSIK